MVIAVYGCQGGFFEGFPPCLYTNLNTNRFVQHQQIVAGRKNDWQNRVASAAIEATIMSGVDGRSSSGRELLDHISIGPFSFETDDSTHGFLDSSSCKDDANEDKDGSSGSSRSSIDGKCGITQVDEALSLFNKSQVQPATR